MIDVKVLSEPDDKGLVDVQSGDKKIKVYSNGLLNKVDGQPKEEKKPAENTTAEQIPAEGAKKGRYESLTPEQKTKYQELKTKWVEEQKKAGKNTEPGQGTRDTWYKQLNQK